MANEDVKVDSLGVLMRRADRLEDEAKAIKAMVAKADAELARVGVPEKARARTGIAYRREKEDGRVRLELVVEGGDE